MLQLVNSYLKETGNSVSWIQYFISNFPVMLVWLIVLLFMVRILFKQDASSMEKSIFKEKYEISRKMSKRKSNF